MFYSIISAAAVRFRRVPSREVGAILLIRKEDLSLFPQTSDRTLLFYLFQRQPACRKIRHKSSGERKAKIDQESRPKGIA